MAILTNEEKRSILFRAQTDFRRYGGSEKTYQELYAALKIIEKTFGEQWYQKATKGLSVKMPAGIPSDHNYLLEEDKSPPLTRLLKGGVPSNIARIIQFATYIQELSNSTNVQDKLNDYLNQERRVELSFGHFTRLLFELKVASVYERRGLGIHFLPKQKRVTPDFAVSSPLGRTYVECKRKDIDVKLSKELNDIYGRIIVGIQNEMSQLKLNYSVKVLLEKEAKIEDIKPAISMAHNNLIQKQEYFKTSYDAITIEGTRLAGHDVVHSSKEIPEIPYEPTLRNFDYYAECNVHPPPLHDFLSLRKSDLPVRNFRDVVIYSTFYASIVQSILYSIKDASNQLLESSGYGVVAIEISFDRTIASAEPEVKKVVESVPTLLVSMPHISAIFLFLEEVFNDAGNIHRRTTCLRFFNPSTSHKLPEDLEKIMKTDEFTPHKSLLE